MQISTPTDRPPDIADISDNGDGTYDLTYTPSLTGLYYVTLMVQGFPVLPVIGQSYTLSGRVTQVWARYFGTVAYTPATKTIGIVFWALCFLNIGV